MLHAILIIVNASASASSNGIAYGIAGATGVILTADHSICLYLCYCHEIPRLTVLVTANFSTNFTRPRTGKDVPLPLIPRYHRLQTRGPYSLHYVSFY